MNTVAIETDAFLDEVPEPSDDDLKALFEQFRTTERLTDGTPGFRQSQRIRLAYVELNTDDVKKQIAKVTDEDVRKYYDENKETPLIRTPVFPGTEESDSEPVLPTGDGASEDGSTPGEGDSPAEGAADSPSPSEEGTPEEGTPEEGAS